MIPHMKCRWRAEILMLILQPALHTIILQDRISWMCISQACQPGCPSRTTKCSVQMICSLHHSHCGWSISIANSTHLNPGLFSNSCLWNWQFGSARSGQELGIPPKSCLKYTAGELNAILKNKLVPCHCCKGQLWMFCCIQWECELYSWRPKAQDTMLSLQTG